MVVNSLIVFQISTNACRTHVTMEVAALTWSMVILANALRDTLVSTVTTVRLIADQIEVC